MHRIRKKRKIIIYALIGVLMLMTVGYASFQSSLSIKGSSKVTSNWDIEITNITDGTPTGSAENGKDEYGNIMLPQISEDKLSALISSDLYETGDSMTYVVTIQNKGSLDAIIDDIIPTQNDGNDNVMENEAVKITFSGYTKGQKLYKQGSPNSSIDVTVKVEYNPNYTGGETSFETNLEFIFKQAESKEIINDEVISEDSHKVTYDYITTGGSKKTYEEYHKEGEEIDLTRDVNTPYDVREEYIFKGWNTDSSASDCLKENNTCKSSTTMGNSDIHLYAIYEEDNISLDVSWTSTSNSITIVASSSADSGINKYEYSIDKGQTYVESSNNMYTFNNLQSGYEYPIRVRVTSNTNKKKVYSGFEEIGTPTNDLLFWGSADNPDNTSTKLKNKVSGNDGILNNFNNTSSSGYNGTDLVFDGIDDYVDLGLTGYDYQNGQSMVIYVKLNDLSNYCDIFNDAENGGGGLTYDNNSDKMTYSSYDKNISNYTFANASTTININNYYVVIGTYNGDSLKIYINGELAGTSSPIQRKDSTLSMYIGASPNSNGTISYPSNITVKEAMLYDRTLTQEEVTNITNNFKHKYNQGTSEISKPTFKENSPGEVTITYPSGCGTTYTCKYKKNNEEYVTVNNSSQTIIYGENGTLLATIEDGHNKTGATYTLIKNNLYVKSDGNDSTGYGTINTPYATITKAYEKAADSPSTIYVMDNVTQSAALNMNSNKDITLTSCTKSGSNCNYSSNNSIIRGSSVTSNMLIETNGSLRFNNITIDGNNVESQAAMISLKGNAYINQGTIIKRALSVMDYGGAFNISAGKTVMNGGEISNNTADSSGGPAIFMGGEAKFVMNGGQIKNNHGGSAIWTGTYTETTINDGQIINNVGISGGGGIDNNGTLYVKGGIISGNTASSGGGIYCGGETTISGGKISNNTATNNGGAIYVSYWENHNDGYLKITGGEISNNQATNGGGIYLISNTNHQLSIDIMGGTISGNKATSNGGGLYSNGTTTVNGGTINNNTDSSNGTTSNITLVGQLIDSIKTFTCTTGNYKIISALNNNFAIDKSADSNGSVTMYTYSNANRMKWQMRPYNVVNGTVYYYFRNLISSTRFFNISGDGADVKVDNPLQIYNYAPGPNYFNSTYGDFFWYLTKSGDNYILRHYPTTNGSFCVHAASAANGAAVTAQNCNNSNNQKWKIVGV